MAIPVFGLQAIKDKATRDAIYQLAQRAGQGDGEGAEVEVQEADPDDNTPGTEGSIIYSTGTDSIWVFTGSEWERAIGGNGIYVQVTCTVPENNTGYSNWVQTSTTFKNDTGNAKALVATIIENGTAHNDTSHQDYTYTWSKNGSTNFVNPDIQNANTGNNRRAVIVDADDIADGGSEAFVCQVSY